MQQNHNKRREREKREIEAAQRREVGRACRIFLQLIWPPFILFLGITPGILVWWFRRARTWILFPFLGCGAGKSTLTGRTTFQSQGLSQTTSSSTRKATPRPKWRTKCRMPQNPSISLFCYIVYFFRNLHHREPIRDRIGSDPIQPIPIWSDPIRSDLEHILNLSGLVDLLIKEKQIVYWVKKQKKKKKKKKLLHVLEG